jgi:thiol reductant ABC exporter CydD subunit
VATLFCAVAITSQMASLSRIIEGAFLQRANLTELRTPIFWLAGAICLRAATLWLSEFASQEIAIGVKERLRNRLMRSLTGSGPLFTQREKAGELATCAVEGAERLDAWYAKFLPHALSVVIVPATLALFVLWIDWPSGIVLMLTGPLVPVFMALIGMMAKRETEQQWAALSRMSGHFLDILQGLPTLHLLGRSSVQAAGVSQMSEHFRRATMRVLQIAFLSGFVLELAASLSTALVAVEIGVRLIEGLMDFRTGLFVLLLAPEFYLPFRMLGASHHAGMEGVAAGERIFQLLGEDRLRQLTAGIAQNRETRQPAQTPSASGDGEHESSATSAFWLVDDLVRRNENPAITRSISAPIHVRFQNVDFQYPGALTPAVRRLNFDLQPGRIHLLTGQSGAGKSTVMMLLLRFVQPTGGNLLVNGQSLLEISSERWRTNVAFVSQHPHFFEGSVLDNLQAARPEATLEHVRTAARMAEADDFVMDLPRGYNTPISEAAARFSGGERQRLAIARAFLKDSPLLLLDEPTSHLDAATATKLEQALLRLSIHRTTLIIAHQRLAFAEPDTVFVLSGGRLVEPMEVTSLTAVRDGRALPRSINLRTEPNNLEVRTT